MSQLNIAWAFDPYVENYDVWKGTLGFFEFLAQGKELKVTPVYVLAQDMLRWVSNVTPPQLKHIEPTIRESINKKVGELNRPFLSEPAIVLAEGFEKSEDVEALDAYLESSGHDFIAFNTHQRHGLSRLFLGSFTESFLSHSHSPTIVIPPALTFAEKLDRVVVPTTFSDGEKPFLDLLLSDKLGLFNEVIFYSKIFHPVDAFAQSVSTALGGGWVSLESYSQEVKSQREQAGEEWKALVSSKGLKATVIIDDSSKDFVEGLNYWVKDKQADLVAMPTFASGWEASLLGSSAREVLRNSKVPMIIKNYSEV